MWEMGGKGREGEGRYKEKEQKYKEKHYSTKTHTHAIRILLLPQSKKLDYRCPSLLILRIPHPNAPVKQLVILALPTIHIRVARCHCIRVHLNIGMPGVFHISWVKQHVQPITPRIGSIRPMFTPIF